MTLNISVIGTGAIGREHIHRCSQVLQNSRVVALNDINRSNCEQVISNLGPQTEIYDNAHDLINVPDVQAILVTFWGPKHEEFVLAAINARKAVFCEVTSAGLYEPR